jgi:hypothetical protein
VRHSKRSLEGEILIDHSASPGLTAEDMAGFPVPAVGKGQVYESPLIVCGHCQCAVIIEPLRTRAREWCAKCDRYICDDCGLRMHVTLECQSVERRIDEMLEVIERHGSVSPLLLR